MADFYLPYLAYFSLPVTTHEVLHIDREHLRVQLPFMFCEEDI